MQIFLTVDVDTKEQSSFHPMGEGTRNIFFRKTFPEAWSGFHSACDTVDSKIMTSRIQRAFICQPVSSGIPRNLLNVLVFCFTIFLAGTPLYSESLPAENNMAFWRDASVFLFNDAYSGFEKSPDSSSAMNRLGQAATLINTQPRTPQKIASAQEILLDLIKNQQANTTFADLANFLLARIEENYLTPPQIDVAKTRYDKIVRNKTGVPLLEISAARLVSLTTFASDKPAENLTALSSLEPLADFLSTPEGIREFHLAMGLAVLENDGDPKLVLDHLVKADKIGFRRQDNAIYCWLVIARLGEKIGNVPLASAYYQKFIDQFPNDPKTFGIKNRLLNLTNNGTK